MSQMGTKPTGGSIHSGSDGHSNLTQACRHDIAVVGFDLRFPQDGDTPEGFRRMMEERRSAMTDYPPDRLNIDAFHDPNLRDGTVVMRGGHFLKGTLSDLAAFDADFFSVHPSEAAAMDPQQRMLLETTYRAFENAGIRLEDVRGSDTSVVTGAFTNDYFTQTLKDPEDQPSYMALGTTMSMLANRVSWFFDLTGPSYNVDAACASSAIAVQHACDQLRRGDVSMAVVAGCNLMLDPAFSVSLGSMQFVSPDSKSHSFDARANGYARGEGIGVVILKRVSDAVDHNDSIRAVIRACRSNSDGRTPGITQPSSKAQARLIEETYTKAGISKEHTRYFEAHGTGTPVGDPAEANAIIESFSPYRTRRDPIHIGAVKSFIGHLEGGAGVAALLKTVMSLESGVIFPNINFERLNPQIYDPDACAVFPQSSTPWPPCSIRRASISSFGYGGANCHIVVDDACSYLRNRWLPANHNTNKVGILGSAIESPESIRQDQHLYADDRKQSGLALRSDYELLLWSANDEHSLHRMVEAWKEYSTNKIQASADGVETLERISYNLCLRRSFLPWRSFAVVDHGSNLLALSPTPSLSKKRRRSIAFAFTGQGAQWAGMGRELMRFEPFATVIEEATQQIHSLGAQWSVKEELFKDASESQIDNPYLAAPLTTIIQLALVELLGKAGIAPTAVCGHSIGEIAAAYCCGLFSRQDAIYLAYYRGVYVSKVPTRDPVKGGMLAVGLSAGEATGYFSRVQVPRVKYDLSVSCENSPSSVTVSGEDVQLVELQSMLEADGVFARRVRVGAGYHSPQLSQIADECLAHYQSVQFSPQPLKVPMISTLTGLPISREEMARPGYWVENMILPVLFKQAIEGLCKQSKDSLTKKIDGSHRSAIVVDDIVEIGPHSALKGPIQQTLASMSLNRDISYTSPLIRKQPADKTFLQLLGQYYQAGIPVRFESLFTSRGTTTSKTPMIKTQALTDAPRYPFNHSRSFWHESSLSRGYRLKPHGFTELLGQRMAHWRSFAPEWRYRIKPSDLPWLGDHVIGGSILYPAAAMVLAAIQGITQLSDDPTSLAGFSLTQLHFSSPIVFPNLTDVVDTRCVLLPTDASLSPPSPQFALSIYCLSNEKWRLACSGFIQSHNDGDHEGTWLSSSLAQALQGYTEACLQSVAGDKFYPALKTQGLDYGSTFQGIKKAWHDDSSRAIAEINVPGLRDSEAKVPSKQPLLDPGTLDSIFQVLLVALSKGGREPISGYVVQGFDKLWLSRSLVDGSQTGLKVASQLSSSLSRSSTGSAFAISESGEAVLTLDGLRAAAIDSLTSTTTQAVDRISAAYKLRTEIDPDLLTPAEVQQRLKITHSHDERLRAYVQWLCFKNPDLDVLEVGGNSTWFSNAIINAFISPDTPGSMLLNTYTYTNATDDSFEVAQAEFSAHSEKFQCHKFDFQQDPTNQGLKEATYDVIFSSPDLCHRGDFSTNLRHLHKLLKPCGKLVMMERASPDEVKPDTSNDLPSPLLRVNNGDANLAFGIPNVTWQGALELAGFLKETITLSSDTTKQHQYATLRILTAKELIREDDAAKVTTILLDPSSALQQSLANDLQAAIEWEYNTKIQIKSIHEETARDVNYGLLLSLIEYDKPALSTLDLASFDNLRAILRSSQTVLWIAQGLSTDTRSPGYGMSKGFAKVFELENIGKRMVTLELDWPTVDQRSSVDTILRLFPTLLLPGTSAMEEYYTGKDGALCISRYTDASASASAIDSILSGHTVSDRRLSACRPFQFVKTHIEGEKVREIGDHELELAVSGVSLAPGSTSLEPEEYRAYAGNIVKSTSGFQAGDRVCVFAKSGIRSNLVVSPADLARVPNSVSTAEAAALLQEGHLALHVIDNLARLVRRQSVLVTGPNSLLKHCVISLALAITSTVLTTAKTTEERTQLEASFGEHAVKVILLQDLSGSICRLGNKQADVVIDLSSGSLTQELVGCVSPFGQIVKFATDSSVPLGSIKLPGNVAFRTFNREAIQHETCLVDAVAPQHLLDRLIKYKTQSADDIRRVPLSEFCENQELFARGVERTTVLELAQDDIIPYTRVVKPDWKFDSEATYLIAGGLGDLGRFLARWMVERGAKNLILLSRSGPSSADATELVKDFEKQGVKDVTYEKMSFEDWQAVIKPKVDGSWNLHALLPPDLDFFILTSSLTGVLGQVGQLNYAAANASQDALARFRTSQGMKTISLDLGMLRTGGMVAANPSVLERMERDERHAPLSEAHIRALFEHVCDPSAPLSASEHAQLVLGMRSPRDVLRAGLDLHDNMQRATWNLVRPTRRELDQLASDAKAAGAGAGRLDGGGASIVALLQETAATGSEASVRTVVVDSLVRRIATMLSMPEAGISIEQPLNAYGADSLTGIDLRAWIAKTFGVDVPVFDLLGDTSIAETGAVVTQLWMDSRSA